MIEFSHVVGWVDCVAVPSRCPEHFDVLLLELRVCRQNGKRFVLGLGNQHAIEGSR